MTAPATLTALLRLARTRGLGPIEINRLMARHKTPEAALEAVLELGTGTVRLAPLDQIEAEIERTLDGGASFLCRTDPDFPAPLAAAEGTPWVLTIKGDRALLQARFVGIVGARNASAGGRKLAREIAAELAGAGMGVASGLARGIDTAAHEGALLRGITVAVIATGIDVTYPTENAALMAAIAESGVVLTERPLGAGPHASQFPRRNRLISGLAEAVLVVEAAQRSGSLITARMALEQGREVLAIPGSPLDERHRGSNRLLKEGAHLIENAEDIMNTLKPFEVRPRKAPAPARPHRPRAVAVHTPSTPTIASGLQDNIKQQLGIDPIAVDELIRQCHASPGEVQKVLLELELAGEIERHTGNRVSLAVV